MHGPPDLIKPTCQGVVARPVYVIQRGPDLIKPTTLVNNVQSLPDLINCTSPVISVMLVGIIQR